MPRGSSNKRERQYEHIKESYEKRGQKGRAEEIAARTVNKERAEHGETKSPGKSGSGKSGSRASASRGSSARGGKPSSGRSSSSSSSKPTARGSSRSGSERTRTELYAEAKKRGIEGRSTMNKAQLARALAR